MKLIFSSHALGLNDKCDLLMLEMLCNKSEHEIRLKHNSNPEKYGLRKTIYFQLWNRKPLQMDTLYLQVNKSKNNKLTSQSSWGHCSVCGRPVSGLVVLGLWALTGQSCCTESRRPNPAAWGRSPGSGSWEAWGNRTGGWPEERQLKYIRGRIRLLDVFFWCCVSQQSRLTLEGEPRMVGRGLRCISSLSLGDECKGRTVIRPDEGPTTGSECCFLIFCLAPPVTHSERQGALWSRVPSPALCGCCWEVGRGSACWGAAKEGGGGGGRRRSGCTDIYFLCPLDRRWCCKKRLNVRTDKITTNLQRDGRDEQVLPDSPTALLACMSDSWGTVWGTEETTGCLCVGGSSSQPKTFKTTNQKSFNSSFYPTNTSEPEYICFKPSDMRSLKD